MMSVPFDVTIDGFDCFFVALAVDWPPHIGCLSMKRNPYTYTRPSEVWHAVCNKNKGPIWAQTLLIQGRNMRQGRCHRKSDPGLCRSGRMGSASGILNPSSLADPICPRINFTSGFDPLPRNMRQGRCHIFGASNPARKITSCQDNASTLLE